MRVRYKLFKSARPFGVELECSNTVSQQVIQSLIAGVCDKQVRISGWEQSADNTYWHVKQDSTCGPAATATHKDYGVEIASYKASGLKDIVHISSVADRLKNNGVQVNPNCGFHIHAQIKDFSQSQAGTLLARWIKIEPAICMLVAANRLNNRHCKLWCRSKKYVPSRAYDPKELWDICKPTNFRPYENPHKRVSLNFVNFAQALHQESGGGHSHRKTVELRLPEGTLDKADVSNWVKLFLLFVDASYRNHMPENLQPVENLGEFFRMVGLEHDSAFVLLSPGLHRLKRWVLRKMARSESVSFSRTTMKLWQEANARNEMYSLQKKTEKLLEPAIF
jgi:hypothetical protein